MRCTCVSTQMFRRLLKPRIITRLPVLRPTPGSITSSSSVDGTRHVSLHSTNELLLDPDVTGVKTGYTSKAGRCLIASMFKDGHQLLLVGLNVMDRWEQATQLLRYGQVVLRGGAN